MNRNRLGRRLLRAAAVVGAIFLTVGFVLAGGKGRCYTAEIPAPIVLPDGSTYPAGELKVCLTQTHSPVETLHHTSVDGRPVAMLRSRHAVSEGLDHYKEPFFVFIKRDDGALSLSGFAVPQRNGVMTYQMGRTTQVTTKWNLAAELNRDDSPIILLAAR